MGVELPRQQCRPFYLYCQRVFSRPAFAKSMTLQEKNRYQEQIKSVEKHHV
jgi:hypothetical protein